MRYGRGVGRADGASMSRAWCWWSVPALLSTFVLWSSQLPRSGHGNGSPAPEPSTASAAAPGNPLPDFACLQVEGSPPTAPIALAQLWRSALELQLPAELALQRVELTVFRRLGSGREASPWLQATPQVQADGVLRLAGLTSGQYDVVVAAKDATAKRLLWTADAVAAPGRATLATTPAAAPAR